MKMMSNSKGNRTKLLFSPTFLVVLLVMWMASNGRMVESLAEDKPCTPELDNCDTDLVCDPSTKRCTATGTEGKLCRPPPNTCDPDLFCDDSDNTCQQKAGDGEGCEKKDDCKTGLTCNENLQQCEMPKAKTEGAGEQKNPGGGGKGRYSRYPKILSRLQAALQKVKSEKYGGGGY